jgi:hypothetical protein
MISFCCLGNSRYFKNTNFLLILSITFEKLDFSLMSSGTTLGTVKLSAFGFSSANSSNVVSETSSSPKLSSSNKGASTNVTPIKIKSIKHTM